MEPQHRAHGIRSCFGHLVLKILVARHTELAVRATGGCPVRWGDKACASVGSGDEVHRNAGIFGNVTANDGPDRANVAAGVGRVVALSPYVGFGIHGGEDSGGWCDSRVLLLVESVAFGIGLAGYNKHIADADVGCGVDVRRFVAATHREVALANALLSQRSTERVALWGTVDDLEGAAVIRRFHRGACACVGAGECEVVLIGAVTLKHLELGIGGCIEGRCGRDDAEASDVRDRNAPLLAEVAFNAIDLLVG